MAKARFQLYARGLDGLGWRFVASNNRDVARSSEAFDDAVEAGADVVALRAAIGTCRASTYMDPQGRWRWDVRRDGARVAESSRWYYRRVECEGAMTQFVAACAEAQLSPTVLGLRGTADRYIDLRGHDVGLPSQPAPRPSARSAVGRLA